GLIPAVALGGAVTDHLTPRRDWPASPLRTRFAYTSGLAVVALFFLAAETAAIRGALGEYGRADSWLVGFALYLPLVGTAVVVVDRWLGVSRRERLAVYVVVVALLTAGFVSLT